MLPSLHYDNSFTQSLPADERVGGPCRQVFDACYSRVAPTPVAQPSLVAFSAGAAALLALPPDCWHNSQWVEALGGNRVLPGMDPYAACYGGHQFGNWAGQLGDGRAISLAEVVNGSGERWELQLKGAGPTPYSRHADGRAVMRSSVREFLCSEAMHALGVPTTRALSLVSTGDQVVRDMLYDGNSKPEPGAIVCRMAPSFLRFGSLELPASRGDKKTLNRLLEYLQQTHYPHLGQYGPGTIAPMFREVAERTAVLMAHWMRVGFVHGVMNTDNLSLLGLTIDYGPYGWLEDFDPNWTPNTTDAGGRRYRYRYQPRIALWNLMRLAEALAGSVDDTAALVAGLDRYTLVFGQQLTAQFLWKLGLGSGDSEEPSEAIAAQREESLRSGDSPLGADTGDCLIDELVRWLPTAEIDLTIFFRALSRLPLVELRAQGGRQAADKLAVAFYQPAQLEGAVEAALLAWLGRYAERVQGQGLADEVRMPRMLAANPKYVLRNYLAQEAIDEWEGGDCSKLRALQEVLLRPYDEQPGREVFAEKRPEWARHRAGCSMLSCSS